MAHVSFPTTQQGVDCGVEMTEILLSGQVGSKIPEFTEHGWNVAGALSALIVGRPNGPVHASGPDTIDGYQKSELREKFTALHNALTDHSERYGAAGGAKALPPWLIPTLLAILKAFLEQLGT